MTVSHFLFNRSFCSQGFFYFTSSFAAQCSLFLIRMTQETSKGEIGNGKKLEMTKITIFISKNNFNRSVINVTKKMSLLTKCVTLN